MLLRDVSGVSFAFCPLTYLYPDESGKVWKELSWPWTTCDAGRLLRGVVRSAGRLGGDEWRVCGRAPGSAEGQCGDSLLTEVASPVCTWFSRQGAPGGQVLPTPTVGPLCRSPGPRGCVPAAPRCSPGTADRRPFLKSKPFILRRSALLFCHLLWRRPCLVLSLTFLINHLLCYGWVQLHSEICSIRIPGCSPGSAGFMAQTAGRGARPSVGSLFVPWARSLRHLRRWGPRPER